jgi:hypothetical protein
MKTAMEGNNDIDREIEKILLLMREKEKVKLLEWKGWPAFSVLPPSRFTRQHPADIRDWGINE